MQYSGLVVSKAFRQQTSAVFLGLTEFSFRFSLKNGYSHWYAFTNPNLLNHFRKVSPALTVLETNELTPAVIEKRSRDKAYFEKYGSELKPFLQDLSKVSYINGISLLVERLMMRKRVEKVFQIQPERDAIYRV